jgi:multidrug transporter EmrE-like cation transporter
MTLSGTDESIFVMVFAFLSGFLSMVNLTDFIRGWGTWTGYELFVLPCLRIAAVVLVAVGARRSFRWEGRDAARFAAAAAALTVLLALGSFLLRRSYPLWAGLGTAAAVAAAIVLFAMRFPRALRG